MSRPQTAAGSRPTLVSTEKRPPTPGSWSIIRMSWAESRSRRPLDLPALAGSVMPRKWSCGSSSAVLIASSAAMVCISVSPVPPDFDTATKRLVLQRQPFQQRAVAVGIEIVHEMDARRIAQGADAGHGVAGKLRQGLAAEARAAGAEKDHVGGAVAQQRRRSRGWWRCRRAFPADAAAAACRRRDARAARLAPRRCAPAPRRSCQAAHGRSIV